MNEGRLRYALKNFTIDSERKINHITRTIKTIFEGKIKLKKKDKNSLKKF